MSSAKPTGGPAFPIFNEYGQPSAAGLSIRDYFAAKAMQAVMPTIKHECENGSLYSMSVDWYADHACHAYAIADAMLAARAEVKP
jgi:hypothetical protein